MFPNKTWAINPTKERDKVQETRALKQDKWAAHTMEDVSSRREGSKKTRKRHVWILWMVKPCQGGTKQNKQQQRSSLKLRFGFIHWSLLHLKSLPRSPPYVYTVCWRPVQQTGNSCLEILVPQTPLRWKESSWGLLSGWSAHHCATVPFGVLKGPEVF